MLILECLKLKPNRFNTLPKTSTFLMVHFPLRTARIVSYPPNVQILDIKDTTVLLGLTTSSPSASGQPSAWVSPEWFSRAVWPSMI